MGKNILMFGSIETKKKQFYRHKTPILGGDVDIQKALASNKIAFDEKNHKYFIGYLYNNHKVRLLHIMLLKTSAYEKNYDGQNKCMYFLNEDDGFLEKYNTIWDKVSADIKKEFDSEPVYFFFLKTKIKSHGDKLQIFTIKKFQSWILIKFA